MSDKLIALGVANVVGLLFLFLLGSFVELTFTVALWTVATRVVLAMMFIAGELCLLIDVPTRHVEE